MAFVYGMTNSDILNAADGVTSGDDHVGGDGHDTIRGLSTNSVNARRSPCAYPGESTSRMRRQSKTNRTGSAP
jgi:hypothetical protein